MSRLFTCTAVTAALIAAAATVTFAQGMDPLQAAVKARQSHMFLYQYNLMTLGGMAQGGIPYDAERASAAASNLVALSGLDQSQYWPAGSAAGEIEGTRALPAIWEDFEGVAARAEALNTAAMAMAEVAGTDLAALQGAMGGLAQACGGCHETYRQPE